MKILSISNTELWPWGENKGIPSKFASQKGFADRGHTVYYLCPAAGKSEQESEIYQGIHILRFRLPFGLGTFNPSMISCAGFLGRVKSSFLSNLRWLLFQVYILFWSVKICGVFKPDLIYVHSLEPALCGWFVSKIFKAKFVVRVYGVKELYWRRDDFLFRIKEFRDYIVFKLPADYFIFTYDGTNGAELAISLGVPESKIKNWRNGVDLLLDQDAERTKEAVYKELGLRGEAKLILSTSRLIPIYGVSDSLKAVCRLLKTDPDSVMVFAGDGPQRHELESFAEENGISSRVIFLGIVDHNRIKRLLQAADIFLFLSKYHNATNSMWEAMAAGACIVTTETQAAKEVVENGKHAVLVPYNEFASIPGILSGLLKDKARRLQLGRNAVSRAHEVLKTWPERIEEEVLVLEDLVTKNVNR